MALRQNYLPASGNLSGQTAGTVVAGNTLPVGEMPRTLAKTLSALVSATAATATLTVTFKWQVSNDKSTWYDLMNGSQNAASVVFATGTAAIKTAVLPAPDAIFGWKYARVALVTGVATGASGDLYSMGYAYRYARVPDET
jgi:hypothetical protein